MKRHGCEKSLLISYGIQRRRRFAFKVNGEHGSVQGWDDYSTHAGDAGVVTTTLWCRKFAQQSVGAQLLSIVNRQLVQYFGLYRTRSAHSRTICCSLCVRFSQTYRSYTGTNNNIIHTVHALSATYGKDRLTGGGVWPGGIDRGGGWLTVYPKNGGSLILWTKLL